jgi:hypothetical protein
VKKILFLTLLACLVGPFVFADDADVLPAGVMRLRLIPALDSTTLSYDKDGKSTDAAPKNSALIASGTFEFGLTDQISAGLQWAPGYIVSASFTDVPAAYKAMYDKLKVYGPADLQIGAKVEVAGPKGFVPNDQIRFAVTPGVIVPLDTYDPEAEFKNASAGKEFRAYSTSSHSSVGLGAKADVDYLFTDLIYVNLHGQVTQYLEHSGKDFSTYMGNALSGGLLPLTDTKTTYGLEYIVELEPHVKFPLGESLSLAGGLPFTYQASLEGKSVYNSVETKIDPESTLVVAPQASVTTMVGPLPIELEVQYSLPLMGKSSSGGNTLSAQLKLFYKFY